MATPRRTKKTASTRPKYKQERIFKCRRKKAKLAGSQKRARTRSKARRQKRSGKK